MSKLWNSILVQPDTIEEYDRMTVEELTAVDDTLKRRLDEIAQTQAALNPAHQYDFPHSPEWLRERSKLRSMRESICGIRWSKLKRENPLLQKYVEIANKALDNFFDGNRSVSRVKPVSVSE